jgi:hypothetical protein
VRLTPRASSKVIAVRREGMVDRGQVQYGAESEGKMKDEVSSPYGPTLELITTPSSQRKKSRELGVYYI